MPHSPTEVRTVSSDDPYNRGWDAVNLLVRSGKSWSGHERNCCFLNTRSKRFATISAVAGMDFADDARGLAVVDWDLDGRLDVWTTNRNGPRVRFLQNQIQSKAEFVAFKLEGQSCNRDAIGARLELYLGDGQEKRIQSLRAGEGFVSQSSKWVHFGVGDEPKIDHLIVRWPGGEAERFTGLAPNARYTIKQGAGRAELWTPPKRTVRLVPSEVELPETTQAARIVSLSKPLVPSLAYRGFDGGSRTLAAGGRQSGPAGSKPVLVNLWASWCSPCLEELNELSAQRQALGRAGVDVVALCVDDIVDARSGDVSLAKKIIDRLEFPFASGVATKELVQSLDTVHRSLVDYQSDLPVPSSFLIDSNNQLAVLYKGKLSTKQLLEDLKLLSATPEQLRAAAVPFAGSWFTKPIRPNPQDIALKYLEQGAPDKAVEYLQSYLRSLQAGGPAATDLAEIYFLLGRLHEEQKKFAKALAAYQHAVRTNPQYRKARINLGDLLLRGNRPAEAVPQFKAALAIESEDPNILVALGVAYRHLGQVDRAVECYQEALRFRPGYLQAQTNLARLWHAQGKSKQAVKVYRDILRKNPDSASDANNLAWILATSKDEEIVDAVGAVKWAKMASDATQNRNARYLTTLAAAYAENGDFEKAIATVTHARRLATSAGQSQLVAMLTKHLELYKSRRTIRTGGSKSPN